MAKKNDSLEQVPQNTALEVVPDYGEDAGAGFEDISKGELLVPWLALLQSLSPIVVEEKAKSGQFLNTATGHLWERETGLLFVPALRKHYWAEWVPRNEGGGFRGHHEGGSREVLTSKKDPERFGRRVLENGNHLVETYYVYGLVCNEDGSIDTPIGIAFSSTKIKPYRGWLSKLHMFGKNKIPLYANLVRITAKLEKNDKGTFYVPVLSPAVDGNLAKSLLPQSDERYQQAKAFAAQIESGDAKIDPNQQNAAEGSEEAIPF
jgi:hypothetical protein